MYKLAAVLSWLLAALLWYLYAKGREKSRDYATDLAQVIHDHDLDSDDLRRSLNHDEITRRVDDR